MKVQEKGSRAWLMSYLGQTGPESNDWPVASAAGSHRLAETSEWAGLEVGGELGGQPSPSRNSRNGPMMEACQHAGYHITGFAWIAKIIFITPMR